MTWIRTGWMAAPCLLVVAACGEGPTAPPSEVSPFVTEGITLRDGVRYRSTTAVPDTNPTVLIMAVSVINLTDSTLALHHTLFCAVWPAVFQTPTLGGTPAWNTRRSEPYGACPAAARTTLVQPGDSVQTEDFQSKWLLVSDVFGDSLGPGHYYFAALWDVNGHVHRLPAGAAVVQW
jgi:hypothetical protein